MEVDPDDDAVLRYVVWHFRFDGERRERRNVVLGAYDDPTEFEHRVALEQQRLTERIAAGEG